MLSTKGCKSFLSLSISSIVLMFFILEKLRSTEALLAGIVRALAYLSFPTAYPFYLCSSLHYNFSKPQKTEQLIVIIVWHSFNALIMLNTAKSIELFTHWIVRDLLTRTKQKVQWPSPAHLTAAYRILEAVTPEAARKCTMQQPCR